MTGNGINDNYEELNNIIVLNDENGNKVRFEVIDIVKYNSEEYAIVYPLDEENDDHLAVILKILSSEDGGETYVSVEEENTLQAVFDIYHEKLNDWMEAFSDNLWGNIGK